MAVKVLADFATTISVAYGTDGLHEFHQGDIITDPRIADDLLRRGAQVAPVDDTDMVACPRCRAVFSSSAHRVDATVTKVNASLQYDRSYYTWRAGEVVQYPWLVDALAKTGVPLETVEGTECPKCQTIFYDRPSTQNLRAQSARSASARR